MSGRTARERVRAELIREITEIARRQLATEGAAGLSLRAVAREMGMVSSAIYRYFPSRDDLLTALIIDGYNAVGEAVERADETARTDTDAVGEKNAREAGDARAAGEAEGEGGDAGADEASFGRRWMALCRAVREWALAHPHEYALLYGSPVPGYQAPADTVPAALRDTVVFVRIVAEAHAAGALDPAGPCPPAPPTLAADMARARNMIPLDIPDDVLLRSFTAWAGMYGTVSFELFGQFTNVIDERAAYFDHAMGLLGRLIGFRIAP